MPTHDLSEAQWDAVLDINLRGTFSFCRAVVPHMRWAGGGCILNIASTLCLEGPAHMAAYAASKAAVIQLTRALAVEYLLDDIRVNSVLLAAVPSEASTRVRSGLAGTVEVPAGQPQPTDETTELRRVLTQSGQKVATSIALLGADEAYAITGSTVAMDRALSAGLLTSTALARAAAAVWR
jgi:NAD(P)-dependent dehydrogenase (short-subunit alcohol dehydrogenase family)